MAAKLVGLLVEEEDVEVTSLALQSDDEHERGGKKPHTPVQDEVEDARRIARPADGNPAEAILAEARKGYDLLVLGASECGSNGNGPLFEDFVDDVIQDAPCSVLILASRCHDDPEERFEKLARGHILVPTSGTDVDRYAAEVAFTMAAQSGAEVDLVHVVSGRQHTTRMGGDEAILQAVQIGEDILAKTAEPAEALGITVNTDVLVADQPEEAILERAQRRADLVVLASGRKPMTNRAFFGHRVDYLIGHADVPVAVVSVR
jgi:nucleotide-binding universal stress UspA family protein